MYHRHGVPMSNLYKAQHRETESEKAVSGPLRYKDTCIFWIQCDQEGLCLLPYSPILLPLFYLEHMIFIGIKTNCI